MARSAGKAMPVGITGAGTEIARILSRSVAREALGGAGRAAGGAAAGGRGEDEVLMLADAARRGAGSTVLLGAPRSRGADGSARLDVVDEAVSSRRVGSARGLANEVVSGATGAGAVSRASPESAATGLAALGARGAAIGISTRPWSANVAGACGSGRG